MFFYKQFLPLLFLVFSCKEPSDSVESKRKYHSIHQEAKTFCERNGMNQKLYFLVDMSIHSGKNRFFVMDLNDQKVIEQGLVTHGACDVYESNSNKHKIPKFSNRDGSHCSSLGKYKIGKREYSSWGINVKYWLHGLETSNSNAEKRVVVLHSWGAVQDFEIYPLYSPLSWGCPAVSNDFMHRLDVLLKKTSKPVLLWIVN
ncbi:MAG: murein L,D-transpeptidase catalytic domain-containing protein [Flavobacterium sp.]